MANRSASACPIFDPAYYDGVAQRELSAKVAANILKELCREPYFDEAFVKTYAWAKATWFTTDGKRFYLRNGAGEPEYDIPSSSKDEVLVQAQHMFRQLLRYSDLYNEYLAPKIQEIRASDELDVVRIDRIYWLRHQGPISLGSGVPLFQGGYDNSGDGDSFLDSEDGGSSTGTKNGEGSLDFCWAWEQEHMEELGPSSTKLESDRLIQEVVEGFSLML